MNFIISGKHTVEYTRYGIFYIFKHKYYYKVYIYIINCQNVKFFNIGVVCALYEADTIVRTIFFCNLINTSL